MNGLSLFSGIGGLDLGLERAGIRTVGQVEIDPWCRRVLAKHWPDVPRHDDVRTATEWWRSEERPHVDLVFGGFPCQDISSAGAKAGIRGARSGLWAAMAGTIRALRPRWVLLENVADILVRGIDVVLADLATLGYDAEWDCVPASSVGAPHRRDRWFAVAYPTSGGDPHQSPSGDRQAFALSAVVGASGRAPGRHPAAGADFAKRGPAVMAGDVADPAIAGWRLIQPDRPIPGDGRGPMAAGQAKSGRRSGAGRVFQRPDDRGWPAEPSMGRLVDGLPPGLVQPQLRGFGNAVVPQVAEHVGRLIVAADRERTA